MRCRALNYVWSVLDMNTNKDDFEHFISYMGYSSVSDDVMLMLKAAYYHGCEAPEVTTNER